MSITRGIVLAREGAELIIAATPNDVQQFGKGVSVGLFRDLKPPPSAAMAHLRAVLDEGALLYDKHGYPFARIYHTMTEHHAIDVTSFRGEHKKYATGQVTYELTCKGPVMVPDDVPESAWAKL